MAAETPQLRPNRGKSPRYQPLVVVLIFFCGGILLDRYWPTSTAFWWVAAAVFWVGWLVFYSRMWNAISALCLLAAIGSCGGGWHHLRWNGFEVDQVGRFAQSRNRPVCLEVVAVNRPDIVPAAENVDPFSAMPQIDQTRFDVEVLAIRDGQDFRPCSGNARLSISGHLLGVAAGDRLRVFCQMATFSGPMNPEEFDYASHSRADRMLVGLRTNYPDCVQLLETNRAGGLSSVLSRYRADAKDLLWNNLDARQSRLASAVLLGDRRQLPHEQTEAFMATGTVHLLAVSGLHVGILASGLFALLRFSFLPRRMVLVSIVGMIVFYALVLDARPPVIRATILITVICTALFFGRQPLAFNSWAAAGLFVLILNPADLFRVGTQLSFLAVGAIALFGQKLIGSGNQDPLDRLVHRTRPMPIRALDQIGFWSWKMFLLSTMIWLVTLPLVMARFHIITPWASVLNLVLWIPMTVALFSGFLTITIGWLIPPMAALSGAICNEMLSWIDQSVIAVREMETSHFWVPGPDDWWLCGFYGGLAVGAMLGRFQPPKRWCVALCGVWIAIGLGEAQWNRARQVDQLRCTFVSVGHGCAVVLELPDGRTMLYDAGHFGASTAGARSISSYLWSRGITHLEAVVISHPDLDHYNALPRLLERFSIGVVYVSPQMFDDAPPLVQLLEQKISEAGVPIRLISAGDQLEDGALSISVLHPTKVGVLGSDNANSIVLAIEYQGRRILLPGDLESPGMEDVMAEEPFLSDVLLAPHHGSLYSSPVEFGEWCSPKVIVISGSSNYDIGPLRQIYAEIGGLTYRTADSGAVSITISDGKVQVNPFRE